MNTEISAAWSKFLKIDSHSSPLLDELENFIAHCQSSYYNTALEVVNDSTYDKLEAILKEYRPKSKALRIRAPVTKKLKVRLPFPMSSLGKINPAQSNVQKWLDEHPGPYIISVKLDGSSMESVTDKDGNWKDYSGGDGKIGGDISLLSPFIKRPSVKHKNIALRGEALVSKGAFKKYAQVFKNPRAMANGLVNTERLSRHVKDLDVVYYNVMHPAMTILQGFKWLKSNGFNTAQFKYVDTVTEAQLSKMLKSAKAKSHYELDGLVVSQNVKYIPSLQNPDHSIAFKENQESDIVQTTVIKVEWNVSAHGYLIPLVYVKPVELFGTTVSKASGKNAALLEKNKIGRGAIVSITKGGEVIPDILKVIKPAKQADMPDEKVVGPYHWDKNHTHLVLDNIGDNETVVHKRIVRFFAAMKVDGIKGATVQKLIDNGYDTILKIVRLSASELGDAIESQKLASAIHKSMVEKFGQADLAQFMDASGAFGRGFGSRRVEMIQKEYPDILKLVDHDKNTLYAKLSKVSGIGPEMAKIFVTGLPKFQAWLDKFPKNILRFAKKEPIKITGKKMAGKSVCFTGFRNEELKEFIQANGGQVVDTASKCNILLAKDPDGNSSKLQAARAKGTAVLSPSQFQARFM